LLAADSVHQEAADDAAGEVEAVYDGAEADVLHEGVVWVERGDDGAGEDAAAEICEFMLIESAKGDIVRLVLTKDK
jgi:hypothetical protein